MRCLRKTKAETYFAKAIESDPITRRRTRASRMLLDTGNVDESIRQLNVAVQRDPIIAMAWYLPGGGVPAEGSVIRSR